MRSSSRCVVVCGCVVTGETVDGVHVRFTHVWNSFPIKRFRHSAGQFYTVLLET